MTKARLTEMRSGAIVRKGVVTMKVLCTKDKIYAVPRKQLSKGWCFPGLLVPLVALTLAGY
jgi:hypothetical protein